VLSSHGQRDQSFQCYNAACRVKTFPWTFKNTSVFKNKKTRVNL